MSPILWSWNTEEGETKTGNDDTEKWKQQSTSVIATQKEEEVKKGKTQKRWRIWESHHDVLLLLLLLLLLLTEDAESVEPRKRRAEQNRTEQNSIVYKIYMFYGVFVPWGREMEIGGQFYFCLIYIHNVCMEWNKLNLKPMCLFAPKSEIGLARESQPPTVQVTQLRTCVICTVSFG